MLTGLLRKKAENIFELITQEGKSIDIRANEIEESNPSKTSLMPEGLEKSMTLEEFADIISYLESLKD